MEEQLSLRFKGLEAAKEGQLEVRERLLVEMEEKARERADVAEAEGFRLKGLLVHMEHMVESLRSQSSDEKDRLRMEHQRLQFMQSALESEKNTTRTKAAEDTVLWKKKWADLEAEARKLNDNKLIEAEENSKLRGKLDADRAEFSSYVKVATKSVELGTVSLKEEEERLARLRDDLASDRTLLEQRKISVCMFGAHGGNVGNAVYTCV